MKIDLHEKKNYLTLFILLYYFINVFWYLVICDDLQGKSSISSNELKPSKVSRLKRGRKDDDFVDDDVALAQVTFFFSN